MNAVTPSLVLILLAMLVFIVAGATWQVTERQRMERKMIKELERRARYEEALNLKRVSYAKHGYREPERSKGWICRVLDLLMEEES